MRYRHYDSKQLSLAVRCSSLLYVLGQLRASMSADLTMVTRMLCQLLAHALQQPEMLHLPPHAFAAHLPTSLLSRLALLEAPLGGVHWSL